MPAAAAIHALARPAGIKEIVCHEDRQGGWNVGLSGRTTPADKDECTSMSVDTVSGEDLHAAMVDRLISSGRSAASSSDISATGTAGGPRWRPRCC
jgi:hypothetical protein